MQLCEQYRPALQRSLRGESQPLDIEDVKARGRQQMEENRITE